MRLHLKFFAAYRERLGCAEETLDWSGDRRTLGELVDYLRQRGGVWQEVLSDPRCLMAINENMARSSEYMHDQDEVAFFPPVTGG